MNKKYQNGLSDTQRNAILEVLSPYQTAHPTAEIDIRSRHGVFIGIRIIDPDFHGIFWADRDEKVWPMLQQLPSEIFDDISMVLLLTPEEAPTFGANLEFENPLPWPDEEALLLVPEAEQV